MSGNTLLTSCQVAVKHWDDPQLAHSVLEAFQQGYCVGLIDGVFDVSSKSCPGEHATHGQALRVVVKYLQDHPEELDQREAVLVEKALAKAFPCHIPG